MRTLLISVDALRAERLGQFGHYRDTMPVLDRLADEGTIFTDVYANSPYTRISVPSFHTSRYLGYRDVESSPTIASVLRESGLHTACIGTLTGFKDTEGELVFDEYDDLGRDEFYEEANRDPLRDVLRTHLKPVLSRSNRLLSVGKQVFDRIFRTHSFAGYTSAAEMTDGIGAWIDDAPEDFFLWVHYMEGHRPYGVHAERHEYVDRAESLDDERIMDLMETAGSAPSQVTVGENELIKDLYDSDLSYCSRHLERLFDTLEEQGLWEDLNIVLTSDHGEEFYDHGMYYHRNVPYDELLHVPLFVKPATSIEGRPADVVGDRIAETRQLLDLAPTVCSLHDVEPPDTFLGDSLYEPGKRRVVASGAASYDEGSVVAGRWDDWKFIHAAGEEYLYDLDVDPGENVSVLEDHRDVAERFREAIPDYLFESESPGTRTPDDAVDEQQLEALGYMEI